MLDILDLQSADRLYCNSFLRCLIPINRQTCHFQTFRPIHHSHLLLHKEFAPSFAEAEYDTRCSCSMHSSREDNLPLSDKPTCSVKAESLICHGGGHASRPLAITRIEDYARSTLSAVSLS